MKCRREQNTYIKYHKLCFVTDLIFCNGLTEAAEITVNIAAVLLKKPTLTLRPDMRWTVIMFICSQVSHLYVSVAVSQLGQRVWPGHHHHCWR